MNICKTYTTAVAILIGLATLSGCHKPPKAPPLVPADKFSLKSFYLGMQKKEAKDVAEQYVVSDNYNRVECARGNDAPQKQCYQDSFCWMRGITVAGRETGRTVLSFQNDQLTTFTILFPTNSFVDISAAFTSEYGKPKHVRKEKVQNRFGASFEKIELRWSIKDAAVTVSNIKNRLDEGSIHVGPIKLSEQTAQCLSDQKQSAKKDL